MASRCTRSVRALTLSVLLACMLPMHGCFFSMTRMDTNDQLYQNAVYATLERTGTSSALSIPMSGVSVAPWRVVIDCARLGHAAGGGQYAITMPTWAPPEQIMQQIELRTGPASGAGSAAAATAGNPAPAAHQLVLDIEGHTCVVDHDGRVRALRFLHLDSSNLGMRLVRRLHYLYTVPLDAVTFPVQLILVLIYFSHPSC